MHVMVTPFLHPPQKGRLDCFLPLHTLTVLRVLALQFPTARILSRVSWACQLVSEFLSFSSNFWGFCQNLPASSISLEGEKSIIRNQGPADGSLVSPYHLPCDTFILQDRRARVFLSFFLSFFHTGSLLTSESQRLQAIRRLHRLLIRNFS